MSSSTLLGRPPERTGEIVRELRARIVRGDMAPGVQLPTRVEIEQLFGASTGTVQKALQELQRDGFVTVNGRQGTFVSKRLPHLTNYALVFPTLPGQDGWNRFYAALNHEAPSIARGLQRQISIYYGASSHSGDGDFSRLLADVQSHRLGGIIFAAPPELVAGTPVLDESTVPRVAIMAPSPKYAMPQVHLDISTMWERSAEYFLQRGRRRLALLMPPHKAPAMESFRRDMVDRGFDLPPQRVLAAPREFPEVARNLTHLLFENERVRPDAFFITDDNLVENALAGLIAAGAQVPHDVEIVAHCNFPHPVAAPVPVQRLGFDARQVLQTCFDDLDGQRAGQQVPPLTKISAQFEDEVMENC